MVCTHLSPGLMGPTDFGCPRASSADCQPCLLGGAWPRPRLGRANQCRDVGPVTFLILPVSARQASNNYILLSPSPRQSSVRVYGSFDTLLTFDLVTLLRFGKGKASVSDALEIASVSKILLLQQSKWPLDKRKSHRRNRAIASLSVYISWTTTSRPSCARSPHVPPVLLLDATPPILASLVDLTLRFYEEAYTMR